MVRPEKPTLSRNTDYKYKGKKNGISHVYNKKYSINKIKKIARDWKTYLQEKGKHGTISINIYSTDLNSKNGWASSGQYDIDKEDDNITLNLSGYDNELDIRAAFIINFFEN